MNWKTIILALIGISILWMGALMVFRNIAKSFEGENEEDEEDDF